MNGCSLCSVDLSGKGAPRLLAHMASHILFDPKIIRQDLPCGLCLQPGPCCLFVIAKGTTGNTTINWSASVGCPNMMKFKYATAKESTESSPCSNVPMECPSCPPKSPAQWRYNLREHFIAKHTPEALRRHKHLWALTSREVDGMKKVWKDRHTQTVKRPNDANKRVVVISDAHTSHATLK